MNLEHIEESIVIVANRHNPSILHPSFLEKEHIIESGLALAEHPFTTPDISIAAFTNGLRITVDSERLQITNHAVTERKINLDEIAQKYLEVLPHVEYKSIGTNVFLFIERENSQTFLINKFIKEGAWNQGNRELDSAGLRFVYFIDNMVVNLSYDPGKITTINGIDRSGILIRGNCHKDILSFDDAIDAVTKFKGNVETLVSLIDLTFAKG